MTESHVTSGKGAAQHHRTQGVIVLLRHGQTAWSESGQHTGRTDIPLTPIGERQAAEAGERILHRFPQGFGHGCVFTSPLHRSQQTARYAGFLDFEVLQGLAEWDYGRAEGRTREQVMAHAGQGWKLWRDGSLTPVMMCC